MAAVERRAAAPVLPPALLALPKVRAAMAAAAVSCFAYFGGMYQLAVWLQHTYRLTPFHAGLAALPMALPVCVMPFFTGRLVARHGPRPVLLTGMSAAVAAGVLLAWAGGPHPPLPLIVAAELALAATGTLSIPGAAAAVAVAAPPEYAATRPGGTQRDTPGRVGAGGRGPGHAGLPGRVRVRPRRGRRLRGAAGGRDRCLSAPPGRRDAARPGRPAAGRGADRARAAEPDVGQGPAPAAPAVHRRPYRGRWPATGSGSRFSTGARKV